MKDKSIDIVYNWSDNSCITDIYFTHAKKYRFIIVYGEISPSIDYVH